MCRWGGALCVYVQLPDLIECKTGEEDEDVIFKM